METHRYVRSQLSSNSTDRYNGIGMSSSSSQGTPQNYWTNGKVTEYWTSTSSTTSTGISRSSTAKHQILARRRTNNMLIDKIPSPRPAAVTAHPHHNKVQASLVAGSFAGIASTLCMYPLEVVRVKLQTSACHKIGPWQAAADTVQQGGIRALYTGLTLPLAAQMVYKATVFTVNNVVQNAILDFKTLEQQKFGNTNAAVHHHQHQQPAAAVLTMTDRFWCGAIAGSVNAACFVTPVEFVRNQLIAQQTRLAAAQATNTAVAATSSRRTRNSGATAYFRGALCVVREAWHSHQGLLSLWRGASWSVSRDALGCGCFFLTMQWAQQRLTPPGQERPSFWTTVASGGLAGLSFWLVGLPMDTAKTWIQTASSTETVSVKEVIQKIYGEHGATGVTQRLFRGWQVAFGRSVPSAAISITSYTVLYQYLQEAL